jgi:ABC-type multidrug transport system fused ATPase/permease subunit
MLLEKVNRIHFVYIIGILLCLLIAAVSIRIVDVKDVSEKLSFALTFASLLLAFFAIVQASHSTASMSQTFGALSGTAERIESASRQIFATSTSLEHAVENIPQGLERVAEQVDQTRSEMMSAFRTSSPEINRNGEVTTDVDPSQVLKRSTIGVVAALYAASQSFANGRPLELQNVSPNAAFGEGALAALRAVGLIDFKIRDGHVADLSTLGPFRLENFQDLFREMKTSDGGKRAWENLEPRITMIDQHYKVSRQHTENA